MVALFYQAHERSCKDQGMRLTPGEEPDDNNKYHHHASVAFLMITTDQRALATC
jgi:hypothetical protein